MRKLAGRNILIVEDEYLIAAEMAEAFEECGAQIVGPVSSVEEACDCIGQSSLDAAVLDVNLRGEKVFKVAELLLERGIHFVFTTGYDEDALPEPYRSAPRIGKPADPQDVIRALFPAK